MIIQPDFDPLTLPWVDTDQFENLIAKRIAQGVYSEERAFQLQVWNANGYVILKNAIPHNLIDAVVKDYHQIWQERPVCRMQVGNDYGIDLRLIPEKSKILEEYRMLDIHNMSEAAKKIILHKNITSFIKDIFEEKVVAMQSIFLEFGSEQSEHQDFAYVPSGILSHLAAAWIALEDVDDSQGTLFYIPESHKIPKFDFGNGELVLSRGDATKYPFWVDHLKTECNKKGLYKEQFCPKKGDVIIWHGALVNGGTKIKDKEKTRMSLVAHYSDIKAFPNDYRDLTQEPVIVTEGESCFYQWQHPAHIENRYSLEK